MDNDAEVVITRGDGRGRKRKGDVAFCVGGGRAERLVGVSVIPNIIHTCPTDVRVVSNVGNFGTEGDGVVHLDDVGRTLGFDNNFSNNST